MTESANDQKSDQTQKAAQTELHRDTVDTGGERDQPFPRSLMIAGVATILAFLSGFWAWASMAPIEGAVVARGVVSVDSSRKTVQHFEGGIIRSILVNDGDAVRRNQVLIELDDVRATSDMRRLQAQRYEAMAIIARLEAEIAGAREIAFPDALWQADDDAARTAMIGQKSVFESRAASFGDRIDVLEQRSAEADEEIRGLEGQLQSSARQRTLIEQELGEVRTLFEKGLAPKPRVLALERRLAEIDGDLSRFQALIAGARQSISTTKTEQNELRTSRMASIVEQSREERARMFEIDQRIASAQDILSRTQIRSPIDGVVVDLRVFSEKAVIGPGERLLDIVPSDDDLIVEAALDPDDIEQVRIGMPATVRLTSLSSRTTLPIEGRVVFVSADRIGGSRPSAGYYAVNVELTSESVEASAQTLTAGMGAQVFLRTGKRTALDYVLGPLQRVLDLGLREG